MHSDPNYKQPVKLEDHMPGFDPNPILNRPLGRRYKINVALQEGYNKGYQKGYVDGFMDASIGKIVEVETEQEEFIQWLEGK